MTLKELRIELFLALQDRGANTYESHFTSWINAAVLEIASDFALPALKLQDPVNLTITESNWLYDMPDTYQKNLYKCYDSDWNKITIKRGLGDIDALNIEHDETGNHVTHVAIRNNQIGVFPMAAEDMKLWYYKKPTVLSELTDELTCIDAQYHHSVVITKIILKHLHLFSDKLLKDDVAWWQSKYNAGLFGDGSSIGMVNCLARAKKPQRTGGRNPLP